MFVVKKKRKKKELEFLLYHFILENIKYKQHLKM